MRPSSRAGCVATVLHTLAIITLLAFFSAPAAAQAPSQHPNQGNSHRPARTVANATFTLVGPGGTLYAGPADVTFSPGKTVAVSLPAAPAETVTVGAGEYPAPETELVTVTESASTETDAVTATATTTAAAAPRIHWHHHHTTAAILGGTLGGLLLLALGALAFLLLGSSRRPQPEAHEAFSIESLRTSPEERVEPFLDRRVSFLTTRAGESGESERGGGTLSNVSSSTGVDYRPEPAPALAPSPKHRGGATPVAPAPPPTPPTPPQSIRYPPPAHKRAALPPNGPPMYASYPVLAVRNPTEGVATDELALADGAPDPSPPSPLRAPRALMERSASASSMATSLATTLV